MNDYLKEIIKVNIGELLPYFNDDSTEDILVNPDGMVWVRLSPSEAVPSPAVLLIRLL